MAQFHELKVTDVEKTIRDAVVVSLQPMSGGDFSFTQGQYLTFKRDFEGQEIRRSYSICAGKDDGKLQVGIKRVPGGAFSTWANEALEPGDVVEATGSGLVDFVGVGRGGVSAAEVLSVYGALTELSAGSETLLGSSLASDE